MFPFVNKTSTIFYLIVGIAVAVLVIYGYKKYKEKKAIAALNSSTNVKDTESKDNSEDVEK